MNQLLDSTSGIGESSEYEESEYCCEIRMWRRGKKRGRKPKKVLREGHWKEEEHELYLKFLNNSDIEQIRKKIFKYMSEFIKTRSATQCRSHHQKFNYLVQQERNNEDWSGLIDLESKQIWGDFGKNEYNYIFIFNIILVRLLMLYLYLLYQQLQMLILYDIMNIFQGVDKYLLE